MGFSHARTGTPLEAPPHLGAHAPERGRMDLRSYGVGAQILRELGVRRMQLLGMPRRLPSMAGGFGLEVTGHLSPQQEPQAQG